MSRDDDFRTISTFRPIPSLALATLCAFLDKYKTYDYSLKAYDVNIEAYTTPEAPIDTSLYLELLTDYIKNNEYDVLALSAMFVFTTKWVDTAVKLSREYHPKAKIVIGGGILQKTQEMKLFLCNEIILLIWKTCHIRRGIICSQARIKSLMLVSISTK